MHTAGVSLARSGQHSGSVFWKLHMHLGSQAHTEMKMHRDIHTQTNCKNQDLRVSAPKEMSEQWSWRRPAEPHHQDLKHVRKQSWLPLHA